MIRFGRKLSEAGELVAAEGLAGPDQAKLVRAGKDGAPMTDGVFPEAKEFLAGYWIVDVESEQRAIQIAAEASAAPGPGGKPLNMPIELRQVMSGPPPKSEGLALLNLGYTCRAHPGVLTFMATLTNYDGSISITPHQLVLSRRQSPRSRRC